MKNIVWVSLLVGFLGVGMVKAQDGPPPDGKTPPDLREQMRQMALRDRALDMREHEQKLRLEREADELQLEQRRLASERSPQVLAGQSATRCERWQGRAHRCIGFLFLLCGVVHILLTVWVYQDIKRRNSGSGIWVVVTLLAGLCGAAVYALVRLGEKQETKPA